MENTKHGKYEKSVKFEMNTVFVRGGKGDKDRTTILPEAFRVKQKEHPDDVKRVHEDDLARGHGEVHLPYALGRKYPGAGKDWARQYVFPAARLSVDPRSGRLGRHHIGDRPYRRQSKKRSGRQGSTSMRPYIRSGKVSQASACEGGQRPGGSGTAGS